jgi:putative membrane-bound dehydrogenase-like protein
MKTSYYLHNRYGLFLLFACYLFSCNGASDKSATIPVTDTTNVKPDTLTEVQRHQPENALKGLVVADGLEVRTLATEPMLLNPTNIDVDEHGRVWVTEAYNYRPSINGNPTNALGDRIMILEDTNGDGKADTAKVFYQGPELNAPLGICVLGNRVLISQSPYIWSFYDDNGDDKADRKEILFQGIGGEQHDHGVHAMTFGPDGKLYFNMGNEGKTLKDKNGKPVIDQDGDIIGPQKYKQGLVFRCNPDGSQVECLGQNFRNPYEVAVDSYGTLWQSDNDDDGNRATRINFVMEYGNYGYTDEMTGAGWSASRTNMEDSIPLKHWHLNDPGSVPNLLQTGAGSPTGMVIYEGNLLPNTFYGQMIHCDAGPNVVRSYPVRKSGAGYTATITPVLKGEKDQWFRPADICVAPDGSLIVADWYDPGVGGHAAGDQTKGRIYRVAPPGKAYTIAPANYTTAAGAVTALQSPNLSTRYHAFTVLQAMGTKAVPELEKLWNSDKEPAMRARAFWALVKMPGADANKYIRQAIAVDNNDLRITALRAARQLNMEVAPIIRSFINNNADAAVLRACAIALHHNHSAEAPALWTELTKHYDGKDRWYLEALGIGADQQWDQFLPLYLEQVKHTLNNAAVRDIVWRSRTTIAVPLLASLATDPQVRLQDRLRYFRAFDFNDGKVTAKWLLKMIADNKSGDTALNKLVLHHLDAKTVQGSPLAQQALKHVLASVQGTDEYVLLVRRYSVKSQNGQLLQLALSRPQEGIGRSAAGLLLEQGGGPQVWKAINSKDTVQQYALLKALTNVGSKTSIDILQSVALNKQYPMALRKKAAARIGQSWGGEERVLGLLKQHKVPAVLVPDVVASVQGAWRGSVRSEATAYLPDSLKNKSAVKAPSLTALQALRPNAEGGKKVYINSCGLCHKAGEAGYDFGPALTEIGSKLPREGLLDAIVHPSAGIGFGYEGWKLVMKDGSVQNGIIASKTETDIDLKLPGGSHVPVKTSRVLRMQQMNESMMPEGLYATMSTQELADLLEYLSTLKKK